MIPILLDFETRSRANLKAVGGRNYWDHPSTEPLCCSWYDPADQARGTWLPGERWPHPGRTLAAHNMAGFDRFGCYRLGWIRPEDPWIDTSELARRAGLPGALDALGQRWAGVAKDHEANRFTVGLSAIRRPKSITADEWKAMPDEARRARGRQPEITIDTLARVVAYCDSDVDIMIAAWPRLEPWLPVDADVSRVERVVNDRGIAFDENLALALLEADTRLGDAAVAAAAAELGWSEAKVRAAAKSPQQFTAETGSFDARAQTVKDLDHPLARARLALASICRGKLIAGLMRVSPDGRMRDTHKYYGGHTGRWSSKGMQLHNLPRPSKRLEGLEDDGICALADRALRREAMGQDEIAVLLRSTLVAPPGKRLVVADFAGVEARANCWAAGDERAVEIYREGKLDVYKVMATTIWPDTPYDAISKVQRTVGKQAELGCGYGMGGDKFDATCMGVGVDLEAAGVDAGEVVAKWRELHAPIVRFWYACERAFRNAIEGHAGTVSCFEFAPSDDGSCVAVFLPSGRPVVYQAPECQEIASGRVGLSYHGTKGREHIYGGKIVENLIQAMCRDLMASAMVEAERVGLCPVMHVHDEIVCEVDQSAEREAEAELRRCMLTLPGWAPGFPVGTATFTGRRYRK